MGRIVVVIDDDEDNRAVISEVLTDAGFAVRAYAAADAVDVSPTGIALFVLDGGEPLPHVGAPAVVVSASANIAAQAERVGARAWLRKPFAIEGLIELVRRYAV